MVEVELSKIIIDEERKEQVVVLKERKGKRFLPIIIGINEAIAIRMQLRGFIPPRPLTHDLMKSIITKVNLKKENIYNPFVFTESNFVSTTLQNGNDKVQKSKFFLLLTQMLLNYLPKKGNIYF
ncbi:MAG: hypothetical protein B6D55_03715 [Candidatus Omnitrophica bacterium 4484_70.2]|nr:MAG: hypothetical protein B6D55_03715 [Candidatus Omnitrophica bacterium 4484_70.2]